MSTSRVLTSTRYPSNILSKGTVKCNCMWCETITVLTWILDKASWPLKTGWSTIVHPKLHNINIHNVTHPLISWNPRERISVVQISLLIVIFLSLISLILSLMQTTKEVNLHPRIAPCVNTWSVTFLCVFFLVFLCHLLNVGACICHIVQDG